MTYLVVQDIEINDLMQLKYHFNAQIMTEILVTLLKTLLIGEMRLPTSLCPPRNHAFCLKSFNQIDDS